MRGEPRHFVHSKAMCWVVIDRAITLLGQRADWVALRGRMLRELLARGRDSGAFLGTFRRRSRSLGLINSAVNLELVRRHGTAALRGSHADRARRAAWAPFGWRGVLAAFVQTGRLALRSSPRSRMTSY